MGEVTMVKNSALVIVTDYGFLVPSLMVAEQISLQKDVMRIVDIFVLLTNDNDGIIDGIRSEFEQDGLYIRLLDNAHYALSPDTPFHKTHVPHSTLARFALLHAIPAEYENIVYVDGDIQIMGSILPLVSHKVRPGFIAATSDFLWLCEGDSGKFWPKHRGYLKSLGIQDPKDYFNAGVLAFRRDTWSEMAPLALDYFKIFPERCIYHDQSALNAVFAGKREVLSPAYNFNSFYADLGVNNLLAPRIAHFTGGNKPWYFPGPPWNGRFIGKYADFLGEHADLAPYCRLPSAAAVAASVAASKKARLRSRLVTPWRQYQRRKAFNAYLNETHFAF